MVVVEGPAANTGRGWSWLRSGDEEKEEKEKEEKRRRGRGGAATDIKSNNPHLAGGEKPSFRQAALSQTTFYTNQLYTTPALGLRGQRSEGRRNAKCC